MANKPTRKELEQRLTHLENEAGNLKQAEKTLKIVEGRLHYLLSTCPAVIYTCEPGGRYPATFVSENVEAQLGYKANQFVDDPAFWADHIHPEDRLRVFAELQRLFELGHHIHEYRFLHSDGTFKWMRDELRLLRDEQGKPVEIVGYWVDISERKRAEVALKQSEEKYRDLVENINDVMYSTDKSGIITYINPVIESVIGYRPSEIIGKSFTEFIYEEDLPRIIKQFQKVISGHIEPSEYRLLTKSGEIRWVRSSSRPIVMGEDMIGLQGVLTDITERKRAEEALWKSEERFQQIVQLLPLPISIIDLGGRYSYVNKEFTEVFGYTLEDIPTGKDWFHKAYPDPEYRRRVISAWKLDLEKSGEYQARPREFKVVCKDGTVRDIMFRPVSTDNGKQFIIYEDLTEYKRSKEELKRHRDHLEQLVADRTAELTKTNQQLQQEVRERQRAEERLLTHQRKLRALASSLSLAEERGRRHISMEVHDRIGQSLAFAKIQLGTLLKSTPSDSFRKAADEVVKLVDEAIIDTRFLVSELSPPILYELGFVPALQWLTQRMQKRYSIVLDLEDDGEPKLLSNEVRVLLFQSVRELLANVVKHAQAERAKVSIARSGDHIRIEVNDDGVGFNLSELRLGADKDDRFGLFSIRERLQPLGGDLTIISTPGQGTQVTLMGPLELAGSGLHS
jgi:PAS domain S-box-containing protein